MPMQRAPQPMRWPETGDPKEHPTHGHAEPHSDPSHHIGPCDRACRQGLRFHMHEDPRTRTFGMAASRAQAVEDQLRAARGLKPQPGSEPNAPPGWMTPDEYRRALERFYRAKYNADQPIERV